MGTCRDGKTSYPCEQPSYSSLSWTAQYAQSCVASWGSIYLPYFTDPNSGTATVYPKVPATTYTLTCTNLHGTTVKSAEVTVGSCGNGTVDAGEECGEPGLSCPGGSACSVCQCEALPPLSVTLSAGNPPSGGNIPLNDVDLTAIVSGGNSADTINYKFYCNSTDSNPDITPPFTGGEFNGETAASKTSIDACDYTTAGTFYPKVVAQRGSLSAAARVPFIANSPTCITGVWESGACGGGTCPDTEREWTRTITPACDPTTPTTQCVIDPTCSAAGTPSAHIYGNGIDASSITIDEGDPVEISWESDYVDDCIVTPEGWTGPSGSQSETLSDNKTYDLDCTGPNGDATDTITVFIQPSGGGDVCEVVLTKSPDSPTQTDIQWSAKNVDFCEATTSPTTTDTPRWNALTTSIAYGEGEESSGWVYDLKSPPGTSVTYVLACNCSDDLSYGGPDVPGGNPPYDIWSLVVHPGAPFIEEINPGTARFNIFDFFRNLVSVLVNPTYAG